MVWGEGVMSDAPERIWVDEDAFGELGEYANFHLFDQRVDVSDVEYVRADLYEAAVKSLDEVNKALYYGNKYQEKLDDRRNS